MTGKERLDHFLNSAVGPSTLAVGLVVAGFGTLNNRPEEYGTHWDGFGKRFGIRLAGLATGNAMEGGLAALLKEDPRYVRLGQGPSKLRAWNAVKFTVIDRDRNGDPMPAYARLIAIPGNSFLSNTWRPDSDATVSRALSRTAYSLLSKMGANALREFWPDLKRRGFKNKQGSSQP